MAAKKGYKINKKLLGKAKPTAAQKIIILRRLKAKYPQMFEKPGWGKKLGGLKSYAKETGSPSFRGASGADLAELKKRFRGKKK